MQTNKFIRYREANKKDIPFMTKMLLESCAASEVYIDPSELSKFPDTEIYVKGWDPKSECGIIAENESGKAVGATWIRNLSELGHWEKEQLPEITVAVLPEYRRHGIASDLMNRLYKLCQQKDIHKLSLGVHQNNIPAINLYIKQGWVKEGEFKEYIMMTRNTSI